MILMDMDPLVPVVPPSKQRNIRGGNLVSSPVAAPRSILTDLPSPLNQNFLKKKHNIIIIYIKNIIRVP